MSSRAALPVANMLLPAAKPWEMWRSAYAGSMNLQNIFMKRDVHRLAIRKFKNKIKNYSKN